MAEPQVRDPPGSGLHRPLLRGTGETGKMRSMLAVPDGQASSALPSSDGSLPGNRMPRTTAGKLVEKRFAGLQLFLPPNEVVQRIVSRAL